jgi:hypothetical protein
MIMEVIAMGGMEASTEVATETATKVAIEATMEVVTQVESMVLMISRKFVMAHEWGSHVMKPQDTALEHTKS